jgi:hypothetical protein
LHARGRLVLLNGRAQPLVVDLRPISSVVIFTCCSWTRRPDASTDDSIARGASVSTSTSTVTPRPKRACRSGIAITATTIARMTKTLLFIADLRAA